MADRLILLLSVFGCFTCCVRADGKEVLPDPCDCKDWYGRCKNSGEKWIDDDTWRYECSGKNQSDSTFVGCQANEQVGKALLKVGENVTIDGFWYSCSSNEQRHKYEQEPRCTVNESDHHVGEMFRDGVFQWICLDTGRWVTGCFYQNETKHWVLLKIGETGYNGLVKHVCDRYLDHPGRVQYYAQIRDDVPHKSPTNKGKNQNLPELVDNRLKEEPVKWLHENAAMFIGSKDNFGAKIRFLPASRRKSY
ncbi:hypothetical protein QR680_011630 [Steinernema hermaphroditum]|uniref:Abnormal cell migration protein 18-like fibronectin type I domain-containing protein n=1 Tax=Steinernema hermaphroditum TaxID=289476 RepID=A0AA39HZ58_9BILA|nr:hypothetical protein QR680_011630 [Steinernema hermaphroditum]